LAFARTIGFAEQPAHERTFEGTIECSNDSSFRHANVTTECCPYFPTID
jgi:hypothetical protein